MEDKSAQPWQKVMEFGGKDSAAARSESTRLQRGGPSSPKNRTQFSSDLVLANHSTMRWDDHSVPCHPNIQDSQGRRLASASFAEPPQFRNKTHRFETFRAIRFDNRMYV
jgi:hypothetical protein